MQEAFLVLTPAGEYRYAEVVPLAVDYVGQLAVDLLTSDLSAFDRLIDMFTRGADEFDAAGS